MCIISLHRKLELIAMKETGKIWFHSKIPGIFLTNSKSLKQMFLKIILDKSKSTCWKIGIFSSNFIFKIKLQLRGLLQHAQFVGTCQIICQMISIISSDSNLTLNIIRNTTEVGKKRWIKIEFWHIRELMNCTFRQLIVFYYKEMAQ